MTQMIFVNLPVVDLARSVAFYEWVGATKNPQFSDDSAAMVSFSDSIHFMLLTHPRFASFTTKPIIDARQSVQAMFALSRDSREAVDKMVEDAQSAGGRIDPNPVQDHGFMYGRSFEDPDGHIIEVAWMDVDAVAAAHLAPPQTQPQPQPA